jgi:guanine nucleotide-binding protein subunit alpha
MRLIHKVGFTPEEIESYRQLVFGNLVNGMRLVLESMPLFDLSVEESNQVRVKFPRIHSRPFFPYERHVTAR